MSEIQKWLQQMPQQLVGDFFGIAMNVAAENQPKEIRWLYTVGNLNEKYRNIRLQVGRGIAGIVWKTGRLQVDQAIFSDPAKLIEYPIARLEKLASAIAAPVMVRQEVVAVLLVGVRRSHIFSESEKEQLTQAAKSLGKLLEAKRDD